MGIANTIKAGNTVLGIEFGSTRIKAVLIDENNQPIASGDYGWENQLVNGIWTYNLREVWKGIQECYKELVVDVKEKYDVAFQSIGAIGISAMMHGYLPFDKEDNQLTGFRTWRNTITQQASEELTNLFGYHIPQRWSIAHLYQAILNGEEHVKDIAFITTLAGYVHWRLTGRKVLGSDDASGMFPIDIRTKDFNQTMMNQFDERIADKNFKWKIRDVMPKALVAGEEAGVLTVEGARLLDPSGVLKSGIPCCPPEGDGGTGMTATNSVAVRTGNVSAGTSVFAMVVLEKELSRVYPEIDLVTTPAGDLVAMVHCNNCTSDLNAWVNIFKDFSESFGIKVDMNKLFGILYNKALDGDKDCGGLLAYNFFSGEHIVELEEGRPLLVRNPDSKFTLANLMRVNLMTSLGTLKIGYDLLKRQENVSVDKIYGHGGLFKTPVVGQSILAAALDTSVSVMDTAGEGGAWGIALLASYMKNRESGEDLSEFLNNHVFGNNQGTVIKPDAKDVAGFDTFVERFKKGLSIEKEAIAIL